MFKFISKIFDYNAREIDRLRDTVQQINSLEEKAKSLADGDFKKETEKLRQEVAGGKELREILPWAYALVREASHRVLGQRHFDVQLIAGIALHEGKIAEQKTGEGKTLSATAPMYLNALSGKGVHLVTVNDYLARRDAGWMGKVYSFLGMSTAAIISDKSFIYDESYEEKDVFDPRLAHLRPVSRKEAYAADITYGINSEFGFDYLRDNMAGSTEELVQREFNFAIIDEADSVLIDEARTPHIISAPFDEDVSKYYRYAQLVKKLDAKSDYVIDEKARTANLTEKGIAHIEEMLGVSNVYEKDYDTLFHIEAALKAESLFHNNKEYIVKDGEIIIVDEFTGRLLQGRRFSEGIHQAIEAKENVKIQRESKTLATVSLQNYFRLYKKLAGMTGTAATEAEEFSKIYKTDVLVIPTHRPMVRKDMPDMIYKTERAKFNAVVEEVASQYMKGRPVLIGTTSIEKNEYLSALLRKKGIPHELLNAKNHEREAQIISQAGKKGAVTVATNMAGRGVDIVLQEGMTELGGLYVIGTERHESRRIDNQLRGRSGRQGDPGESRFFVSLEDELMRIFGGEQISKLMTMFNFPEEQALTHPMVSRAIESAQVKVEGFNFDIRKHLVDFDDVLNKQREIIYSLRRKILSLPEKDPDAFRQTVFDICSEETNSLIGQYFFNGKPEDKELFDKFIKEAGMIIPVDEGKVRQLAEGKDQEPLEDYLLERIGEEYGAREKQYGTALWLNVSRMVFLSTLDAYWTEHLTAIEDLREGINLRGYAQMDPLVAYKNEAFSLFKKMVANIDFESVRRLFKVQIEIGQETPAVEEKKEKNIRLQSASGVDAFAQAAAAKTGNIGNGTNNMPVASPTTPTSPRLRGAGNYQLPTTDDNPYGIKITAPGEAKKQPGRNDPCWCGSGKKYKKCHYPQMPA